MLSSAPARTDRLRVDGFIDAVVEIVDLAL